MKYRTICDISFLREVKCVWYKHCAAKDNSRERIAGQDVAAAGSG